jgi:hypothetical protein
MKFILLILMIIFTQQTPCTENDIKSYLTDCHEEKKSEGINLLKKALFYWPNDCTQDGIIKLPNSKEIICDLTCGNGEFITYDIKLQKLVCVKCPIGTYSEKIRKYDWTEAKLADFSNNCYIITDEEKIVNKGCDKFIIVDGVLTAGGKMTKIAGYFYELVYNVHIKRAGRVKFLYKKNTTLDYKYNNGHFNFFVDYDIRYSDNDLNEDVKEYEMTLEKGTHSLMWQYKSWFDAENMKKSFNLQIISLEIEGHNDFLECHKCNDKTHCELCPYNSYLDENVKFMLN